MPALTQMPTRALADQRWRACLVVLCGAFEHDSDVWAQVTPGEWLDLADLAVDPRRTPAERMLLTLAAGLARPDGGHQLPVADLVGVGDGALRIALDALAVARGRVLPVD